MEWLCYATSAAWLPQGLVDTFWCVDVVCILKVASLGWCPALVWHNVWNSAMSLTVEVALVN
jgi:hypothetical protein